MPRLVRLLARNALIGFAIAPLAVTALVVFDVAGIGSLTAGAEQGWLICGILTFLMGLTFASAQMGFAVMLLPYDQDEPPSGGRPADRHRIDPERDRMALQLPLNR